jgi:hypothetical protein
VTELYFQKRFLSFQTKYLFEKYKLAKVPPTSS